ncbi:MAG TPA: alanine racemase, partial [Bacillota bacterium]|nr:alanine racemase [Bacillota bacterium]
GHGALEVAQTACEAGASWLGVALPEEGMVLRQKGITVPILVFAPLQTDQADIFLEYDLTATVCFLEPVVALSRAAMRRGRTAAVHVKLDTGMGRIGLTPPEAVKFIKKIGLIPGIKVAGLYSHLATADQEDKTYAELQIKRYVETVTALKAEGLLPEKLHLANSAGVLELPQTYYNMVRTGIILYGLYPSAEVKRSTIDLQPLLSLKTRVVYVKRVPIATGISYGQRYHTGRETTIVTLPIGYADGWSRRLSHKAQALIGGKRYPIVGTICMDQCMVDVGDDPVEVGAEVVLIGAQGKENITADEIGEYLGTINYEVTCMIGDRVPRVYINQNEKPTD